MRTSNNRGPRRAGFPRQTSSCTLRLDALKNKTIGIYFVTAQRLCYTAQGSALITIQQVHKTITKQNTMRSSTRSLRSRPVQFWAAALLPLLLTFWLQGCSQGDTTVTAIKPALATIAQATVANSVTPIKTPTIVATAKPSKKPTRTPIPKVTPQAKATVRPLATATPKPRPTLKVTSTRQPKPTNTPISAARAGPAGMAVVTISELPPEAQQTIKLIKQGGPFPYARDGIDFQNREGLLPRKARGYYHEYTVITPGSSDRGARRVIAGANGELYYTDDHYASFSWVN